jgi:hypothetical protein
MKKDFNIYSHIIRSLGGSATFLPIADNISMVLVSKIGIETIHGLKCNNEIETSYFLQYI